MVSVTDHNDHKPKFLRAIHETQITEEDDRHLPKTIIKVRQIFNNTWIRIIIH